MKDTTYRVVESSSPRLRVLRWSVRDKREEIGLIRMAMKKITVNAKDQTLDGCLQDLLRNHSGRPLFRRVKLLESYMMLFDAFDQHTADHHYMEICNYIVALGDGAVIHPASMFAVMTQCRAGGEVGVDRYP